MQMIAGQTVAAEHHAQEHRAPKTWNSNTKLGTTQPRDRSSPFADGSWLAPNRAAHVTGTVAPGGTFKFSFKFHAPAKAGTYNEYFDPGAGGRGLVLRSGAGRPARQSDPGADRRRRCRSIRPLSSAQSFPPPTRRRSPSASGTSVGAWIDLKNVGSQTWKAGVTKLAPTPRDQASALADRDVAVADARLHRRRRRAAGSGRRAFPSRSRGSTAGDYTQTFGLVDEGVTWFSDAANGGGPADDFLTPAPRRQRFAARRARRRRRRRHDARRLPRRRRRPRRRAATATPATTLPTTPATAPRRLRR